MKGKFIVYTKKECPWCDKVKELLRSHEVGIEERTVFDPGVLNFLMKEGLKTVPQVFREDKKFEYGMEHIGGYTDTLKWFEDNKEEDDKP